MTFLLSLINFLPLIQLSVMSFLRKGVAMKFQSIFIAAFVALSPISASAQDDHAKDVPCVGPMCMLTPIWKLGTMMPDMAAEPKQPSSTQSPQPMPIEDKSNLVQPPALRENADAARSSGQSDANNTSDKSIRDEKSKPAPIDADVRSAEGGGTNLKSAKQTRVRSVRHVLHRFAQDARAASRSAASDKKKKSVTVAANETEFDRLLMLASVVKTPSIKVIPAVSFGDGCRRKPADFVVDTMSNPDRIGPAIPIFTESLIFVARKDFKDLLSLRGRQVSFGLTASSSRRVADRVFRSLAIDVNEQPLDLENALDALALGDIDAVALLAPSGFNRLARHDPNFHLLALPDGFSPPPGLKLTRIEPSSYLGGAWPASSLSVVTVDAVLSPSRQVQMPLNAQSVYAALDQRSSQLAANGFDLIGGSGGLMTMRSSAKDRLSTQQQPKGADCDK